MKPFDASGITPGRYLAKMQDGRHVVEMVAVSGTHFVNVFDAGAIFMPPVKRTVYLNIYDIRFTERHAYTCCAFDHRSDAVRDSNVNEAGLLAIAVPIEIEE